MLLKENRNKKYKCVYCIAYSRCMARQEVFIDYDHQLVECNWRSTCNITYTFHTPRVQNSSHPSLVQKVLPDYYCCEPFSARSCTSGFMSPVYSRWSSLPKLCVGSVIYSLIVYRVHVVHCLIYCNFTCWLLESGINICYLSTYLSINLSIFGFPAGRIKTPCFSSVYGRRI